MKSTLAAIQKRFTRVTASTKYLPEVDGLRFVAITWVLLFHLQGFFLSKSGVPTGGRNIIYRLFGNGDQGVFLFFVISGFILCLPFARQYLFHERKVSLASYYFRRLTRIEPPYVIACIVIFFLLILKGAYAFPDLFPHLIASLLYVHSIVYHDTSLINVVFWSLEVEVQFYILAPLLTYLYFLASPVVRRGVVLLIVVVIPLLHPWISRTPLSLLHFIHYFLIGFVVCDIFCTSASSPSHRYIASAKPWLGIAALIAMLLSNVKETMLQSIGQPLTMGLLFLFVLFQPACRKFFGTPWIAVIGGMCYSIYLFHFQIISVWGSITLKAIVGDNYYLNLVLQIMLIVPVVLVLTSLFYLAVEKPFMELRWNPFEKRKTGASLK